MAAPTHLRPTDAPEQSAVLKEREPIRTSTRQIEANLISQLKRRQPLSFSPDRLVPNDPRKISDIDTFYNMCTDTTIKVSAKDHLDDLNKRLTISQATDNRKKSWSDIQNSDPYIVSSLHGDFLVRMYRDEKTNYIVCQVDRITKSKVSPYLTGTIPDSSPIVVSPNGRYILTRLGEGNHTYIAIYDIATSKKLLDLHGYESYRSRFSPDGTKFAATNKNETVGIFHLPTGEKIAVLHGSSTCTPCLCWDTASDILAISRASNGTILYQTSTKKEVFSYPKSSSALSFSQDGKLFYCGQLWELETRTEIPLGDVFFIPNSNGKNALLIGCKDPSQVYLFDFATKSKSKLPYSIYVKYWNLCLSGHLLFNKDDLYALSDGKLIGKGFSGYNGRRYRVNLMYKNHKKSYEISDISILDRVVQVTNPFPARQAPTKKSPK